eukprot:scaffold11152_cov119-Isochrysis_galbana.AAC.1
MDTGRDRRPGGRPGGGAGGLRRTGGGAAASFGVRLLHRIGDGSYRIGRRPRIGRGGGGRGRRFGLRGQRPVSGRRYRRGGPVSGRRYRRGCLADVARRGGNDRYVHALGGGRKSFFTGQMRTEGWREDGGGR